MGEEFAEMMSVLHYAVLAECEEFLSVLLDRMQLTKEAAMENAIRLSASPELTIIIPPTLDSM